MNRDRVLIVEDHADTLRMLEETFRRRLHCEVSTAASVDEAEPLIRDLDFRIIISDYDMPNRNGAELAKILALHPCEAPLLFYTGQQQSKDFWSKLEYPCHAVLKPNLDDLIAIAANFLNR